METPLNVTLHLQVFGTPTAAELARAVGSIMDKIQDLGVTKEGDGGAVWSVVVDGYTVGLKQCLEAVG